METMLTIFGVMALLLVLVGLDLYRIYQRERRDPVIGQDQYRAEAQQRVATFQGKAAHGFTKRRG